MLLPKSRYRKYVPFASPREGVDPFPGIRARRIGKAAGVIEHVLRDGDRLDLLARHYYNDERLWWRILDANPQILFGADLMPVEDVRESAEETGPLEESLVGQVILIPREEEL